MTLCAGCELPIQDRFLLNLLDRHWHVKCVQCHECKACLTDRCFYRNSKIYCRTDFYRLFGQKCSGCLQGISPNDLIRRAKDKVFHLNCFTCMICNKQLSTGEELYVVNDTKFICKEDVLGKTVRGSDAEDDCDMDSGIDTQGGNVSDKEYQLDNDNSRDDKENVITVNNNNNNSNYLNNNSNTNGAGNPSGMVNPAPNGNPGSNGPPPPMGGAPGGGQPPHGGPPGGPATNGANGAMLGGGTSATPLLAANLGSPGGIKEEPGLGMMLGSPATPNSNVSENSNLGPEGQQGRQSVGTNSSAGNCGDGTAPSSPLAPTPEGGAAGGTAKSGTAAAGGAGNNQVGAKRRGPRTTIKAKQLETLKAAFAATPKPTRHIREQLANETGLNMRVIQVWFQNRRSKERRMKQLSAMGARHHRFYRGPRRMRGLRPGDDMDSPDMMGPGFGYIGDNGQEYYSGYQGYTEFFMGQGQEPPMGFLPPNSQGTPPLPMDGPLHPPSGLMCLPGMPDGQYMPGDLLPPASTPEPLPPLQPHEAHYGPPRSLGVTPFSQSLSGHHHEMAGEAW